MIDLTDSTLLKLVTQLGFGVLIFVALMVLLRWVLRQQEKILDNAREERQNWQNIVSKFRDEIEKHTANAKEFHNQVKEAHKYQREEHKEICTMCNHISTGIKEAVILLKAMNGKRRKR
jgi:peptidoglycan hydrolase CwlO-like protein